MNNISQEIPVLNESERNEYIQLAISSKKKRAAKILHEKGSDWNAAFNFMCKESYMKPHMHPGEEKIEEIHLLEGVCTVIYFDNSGSIIKMIKLGGGGANMVRVPAFQWHTYVMHTSIVVTYETMYGVYDPETWKTYANWAPDELSEISDRYLHQLNMSTLHKYDQGVG